MHTGFPGERIWNGLMAGHCFTLTAVKLRGPIANEMDDFMVTFLLQAWPLISQTLFLMMVRKRFNPPSSPPSTRGSRKEGLLGYGGKVDLFRNGSLEQTPSVLSGNQHWWLDPLANTSYQQCSSVMLA